MITSPSVSLSPVMRDAWVEIDLNAIENNLCIINGWLIKDEQKDAAAALPPAVIMAVIKSDAYGHGASEIAAVLIAKGIKWLGVASVDEGCALRAVYSDVHILILSPTPHWAYSHAFTNALDITVTNENEIRDIVSVARRCKKKARVHLKIDTGMHRIGCSPDSAPHLVDLITGLNEIELISVFSHLAKADDYDFTARQDVIFREVLQAIGCCQNGYGQNKNAARSKEYKPKYFAHLASSEATRKFSFTHYDMVRVGLYLYGLDAKTIEDPILPALSLRGRINHINNVEAGEEVGYGLTWKAERPSRLASVPLGYGDGVDRSLSNRIGGILFEHKVNQVGRISMDQMLFDITDVPQAQEGDIITLIGKDGKHSIDIADWAAMLGTTSRELTCRMRMRLPRIYTRQYRQ